jgi:putative Mn2+ efflux pump MntP
MLLAVGLSMDVLSVSTVTGFGLGKMSREQMLRLATSFGGFHLFMPILGWLVGSTIVDLISGYDHWATFLLLAFVGGRMILEGIKNEEKVDPGRILGLRNLLLFSIAVSVDSIAVGLSFSLEKAAIIMPAAMIGVTAFAFTLLGVYLGNKTGHWLGRWSQVVGGVILFGIGLRVLLSHLMG